MDVDDLNESLNVDDDDVLWSIEDDTLFQPCGLISHSSSSNNKTKSVFVTWNEYYLLNYRFKKSKKTKRMEMTKVRIPLPKGSHLRSIHMLEYNTLLVMSDGRVHCFGSIKSLHLITWLKGVRAFARTTEGFSVICHDEDTQKLLLQVYVDLPSLGKGESTLQHTYDITYDEQNIFQCDWRNDCYSLFTISVTQPEEKFMQCIFGAAATKDQLIHIFSIAGHVFALTPQDTDADGDTEVESELSYHIELLCVYPSSVQLMRVLPAQNLCLVYLDCGSVDIWYVSQVLGIKQRQMFHTGAEWLDFDATSDNGDFYYTDGDQLVRLRFEYDAQLDDYQVQRCVKQVPGMQVCAWVQDIEQLVCLSDNNIFYRIAFSVNQAKDDDEDGGVLSDLTPAAMEQLRNNAQDMQHYEDQPVELLAAIQREHEKQQLVAVARNGASFEGSLEAALKFHRQLPTFGSDALLLQTTRQAPLDSSYIYAIIQLRFNESQKLLHSSHWQVLVYHGQSAHVHRLPTDLLLSRKCRIVVPVKKTLNERLPEFSVHLVAFLELHSQISAVLLPFRVLEHGDTYLGLFSGQLHSLNLYNEIELPDLLAKTSVKKSNPKIVQRMISPGGFQLEQISDICNARGRIENNILELYFVNSMLTIENNTEDGKTVLALQSEDVSALYYLKQHLFLNVSSDYEPGVPHESAHLKILKFQHEIDRFYGTKISDEESEANVHLHLESLLQKYKEIRNNIT